MLPLAHIFDPRAKSRCALELPRVADLEERELKRKEWWDSIHELNRFVRTYRNETSWKLSVTCASTAVSTDREKWLAY